QAEVVEPVDLEGHDVVGAGLPDQRAVAVEEGGFGRVGHRRSESVRIVTARAWASTLSVRAGVVPAGASAASPASSSDWKVTVRTNRSTLRPPVLRANPAVGSVWFVPEA